MLIELGEPELARVKDGECPNCGGCDVEADSEELSALLSRGEEGPEPGVDGAEDHPLICNDCGARWTWTRNVTWTAPTTFETEDPDAGT